jgi:hypothetical protein
VDLAFDERDGLLAAVEHEFDVLVARDGGGLELQDVARAAEVGQETEVERVVERSGAGCGRGLTRAAIRDKSTPMNSPGPRTSPITFDESKPDVTERVLSCLWSFSAECACPGLRLLLPFSRGM